ncbi:MAG: glutamine synthetase, partial [Anaerolineae bacterium]|nr:glutamine synthetase [Anaerolineae bacterium]
MQSDEIFARIQSEAICAIDLQFTDVAGIIKTVTIDADQLKTALHQGIWFDGSAVEGVARIAESDMYLLPDLNTFAVLPWETAAAGSGQTARIICDVYTPNGQPFAGDPRGALRRALQQAQERGLTYFIAPELEFYLFRKRPKADTAPAPDDTASYFDAADGVAHTIRKRVSAALRSMGIGVLSSHHEVGGGQHEIDLAPTDALSMADAIITARQTVRTIAAQEDRFATFMPKPITDAPGNGMHVHQWLADRETGVNRFTDTAHDYGLSAEAQHFMAGQLQHAREMCLVLAPLVN